MSRLDFQAFPSVAPTGAPGNDYESIPSSPAAFGGAVGAAEEKLGSGIESVGEAGLTAVTARQHLQNEVASADVYSWAADRWTDLHSKFSQLQGKAALDGLPDHKAAIEDVRQQAMEQATSPQMKAMVAQGLRQLESRYYNYATTHADREFTTYANKVATDARASMGAQALTAASIEDDPATSVPHMNQALYASDDAVRKQGEQGHWDQDMTAQEVAKNRGHNIKEIVKTLVAENKVDKASLIFSANREQMDIASVAESAHMLHASLSARETEVLKSAAEGRASDASHFEWTERSSGVPTGYIGRTIQVESQFGATADRPGSQYVGLAQFGAAERAKYGITDPRSLAQNSEALIREAEENKPQLKKVLGREPNAAEFYLAHQQGAAGASALLANPDEPAWKAIRKFYGSDTIARNAIWGNMPASAKEAFNSVDNVKSADFVRVVKGFYGSGGPGAPVDASGIIDRPEAFRRAQAMIPNNPALLNRVLSAIDRDWGEQRKANEERITAIKDAMPSLVKQIEDGDVSAAEHVPSDLALLGAGQAQQWQEKVAVAKILGERTAQLPMAPREAVNAMREDLSAGLGQVPELYKHQKDAVAKFDAAVNRRDKEISDDPSTYVAQHDAGVRQKLEAALKAQTPEAFQDYARESIARQSYLGVYEPRVLPQKLIDDTRNGFNRAIESDDAAARVGVVGQVQAEAKRWGPDYWPTVMRELSDQGMRPVLRAIGAGADPVAMARLLSLPEKETTAAILKEQTATKKIDDVRQQTETVLAPFKGTMVGEQIDRDYDSYFGLTEKLTAIYVRDGMGVSDAATKAFDNLLGSRWEFRDTWRMPKSSAISADDVQAGTLAVRDRLAQAAASGSDAFQIAPFKNNLGIENNRADSLSKFGRDGRFVTSPHNDGLVLFYDSRERGPIPVRDNSGHVVTFTWDELAKLGPARRAEDAAASFGNVQP
jgi:hypothetical protein